ncbi:MAG: ABC transporter permease [Proteobacteria bacterium]|nr:MAG: ABC transporter permease [Pseudomonadota bacterium]QKK10865.1 MAG: ABC transporter permease [Pseudomonadota bacterium]
MSTGLQTNWIAYRTIATKEIRRFLRIWLQTVLPAAITMGLYLIIFGNLIGPRIGEMAGYRYMDFIIPGVIMMAVITNSYANVVSSFFGAKFQRHIEELLVSPIPNYVILLGYVSGGVARGLCVALAVTGVSMFFWDIQVHNFGVTLVVMAMTAMLFSLAGFINGVFAKTFDDISIIPTFVLTPLTYLGGIFYSIDMLPPFWQGASLLNPILYMVDAFRFGILGVSDIAIGTAFTIIVGFITVLYVACLVLLNKGIGVRT